jgi:glycosyltransferase involved in cell wall biosynthesis
LETYARAREEFARPARLVFVGKDEGDGVALAADVRRLGLVGEVLLAGEVSDGGLAELYAQADVFALFSRFEAFGLVYFEAMARGVPVLTHRLGAGSRLLTGGAVLTAPYARDEAAAALVRLVNDEALRRRLGAEGRALVQRQHSWERCAEQTLAVYEEALALRRGRCPLPG